MASQGILGSVFGAALTLFVACTPQPAPVCEAGQEVSCPCPGGSAGAQRCSDDGSFGACRCAASLRDASVSFDTPAPQDAPASRDESTTTDVPPDSQPVAPLDAPRDALLDAPRDGSSEASPDALSMIPGCTRGTPCDEDGDGVDGPQCRGTDCDDRDCLRYPSRAEVCDRDDRDEDCDPCTVAAPRDGDRDNDTFVSVACRNRIPAGATPMCPPTRVRVDREGGWVTGRDCADEDNNRRPDQVEVCNGLDDNCDGRVDEDFRGGPCGTGLPGACADGVNECRGGRLTCVPAVMPGARPETCNGLDDDCDGTADDDPTGVGAPCLPAGVTEPVRGACRRGAQACIGGRLECRGGVAPVMELCNGVDDDCDGVIDQTPRCPRSCTPTPFRGCGMVEIPGGMFRMGQAGAYGTSDRLTDVTVSAFAMDAYEVTVRRFRQFWEAGHPAPTAPVPYPGGHQITWLSPAAFGFGDPAVVEPASSSLCSWTATPGTNEDLPITCVSYYTALAFCVWDGGRLPTEAEWEFAARGRAVDGLMAGRTFPWGEEPPATRGNYPCDRANSYCYSTAGLTTVTPVGSFAVTSGFYDLIGNVEEWAADYGMSYTEDACWDRVPRVDPLCDRGGEWRQGTFPTRGGSAMRPDNAESFESPYLWNGAARNRRLGHVLSRQVGVRCARSR